MINLLKFNVYSTAGFIILLIVVLSSISLILIQKLNTVSVKAPYGVEFEDSIVSPGSISKIFIKAYPPNAMQTVAVIRYEVINAEVISVTPLKNIAMGACENGLMFTSNQICVDISNGEAIIDGENLLSVELKWGNKGSSYIKANEENGFFNGFVFTDENLANYSNDEFTLPLTGDEALDDNKDQFVKGIDNIVLFLGSFTFILLTFFGIKKLIYSAVK